MNLGISRNKKIAGYTLRRYSPLVEKLNWNRRWIDSLIPFDNVPRFRHRDDLHAFVQNEFGGDAIDFLEFGVYQGASLRMWSLANPHPDSRFFGFDSFEGLPEEWLGWPKGAYSTSGKVPDFDDDPRVRIVVGWFQESIAGFLADFTRRPNSRLIIHNDCDLYSSTLCCLASLNALIRPKTIILFDDFDSVVHEYRALTDWAAAFMRNYRIVGAVQGFCQVAVEITDYKGDR